jgi:TonB family protein
MDDLVRQLRARVDQDSIAQKVRQRAVDFEPSEQNLQALRDAGARAPLLEVVGRARRPTAPAAPTPAGPTSPPPIIKGRTAQLICGPEDSDVPVFAVPDDLGKVATRLRCGSYVTFLERVEAPPGIDKIRMPDGKEGYVGNSYLEAAIATPGKGVSAPVLVYKPEPQYTPEATRDRVSGTVELVIVIDAQGNVTDLQERSQPLGDGLDKSAIDTVRTWRFAPATLNGSPVPVRVLVEIHFGFGLKTP